jgi:transposase
MSTKYLVALTGAERTQLQALLHRGQLAAQTAVRARILLKADRAGGGPALTDAAIAAAVETSISSVERTRRAVATRGLTAALERALPRQTRPRRLDGEGEAQLVTLACSEPPPGQARWTLRLLAAKLVELEVVPSISPDTVRLTLKKTRSSPTASSSGA